MRSFRHRRGRIIFEIIGALVVGSIAAARWEEGRAITSLIAALGLGLYGFYRIVTLFVRNPALAYGDTGVQLGGLAGVRHYRWQQVREIRENVWKRPYIPFMHWLPKERHYLELEMNAEHPVKLRSDMMELPAGGVKEIIESFRAAQIAALGERGAAMARLGAKQPEQAPAPASALQAERWQRLGLAPDTADDEPVETSAPEAVPQAGMAPRPVFGRKVS
jgi:hypothetical protein